MWRKMLLPGAVFVCGCQTPFGFGGDEWDDNVDDPFGDQETNDGIDTSAAFDDGPFVLAAHAYCAEGSPLGMAVDVEGSSVWVTHVGFSDECSACASWSVQALPAGTDVTITYSDLDSTECDCDCGVFGIEYVMTGFTAGTWDLTAGADDVSFDYAAAE